MSEKTNCAGFSKQIVHIMFAPYTVVYQRNKIVYY